MTVISVQLNVQPSLSKVDQYTRPTLEFSTLIGGNGNDDAYNMLLDNDGNIYVAGDFTDSISYCYSNALQKEKILKFALP